MAEAKQVLRSLLRVVRQRIAARRDNPIWHDHIVSEFRSHAAESDPYKLKELLSLATDYRDYVLAVHHEKELLLSYNIGIDRDKKQAAMVKSTAARVGLQLPRIAPENERDGSQQRS